MDLSIIIINWNSKDYLRKCLSTISAGCGSMSYEVLIVDNASFDGCKDILDCEFPAVRFIQSQTNLGFAGANNLAARRASGELLLFLNPDTEVQPYAVRRLADRVRMGGRVGIAGARLLNTDGTLQKSCVQSFPTILNQVLDCDLLRRWFPCSRLWGMAALFQNPSESVCVDAISGACLMIGRALFERVGGFDERYFMYSEDIELAFKVRQAGLKCCYVPAAAVIHHGGGSSQRAQSAFSNVMVRESVYRFMRLHGTPVQAALFRLSIGLCALARLALVVIGGRFSKHTSPGRQSSVEKWISIFRWSLGMESSIARQ